MDRIPKRAHNYNLKKEKFGKTPYGGRTDLAETGTGF